MAQQELLKYELPQMQEKATRKEPFLPKKHQTQDLVIRGRQNLLPEVPQQAVLVAITVAPAVVL
jgi:hypothetical protein